jgi:outer membrane protein insertion porin family
MRWFLALLLVCAPCFSQQKKAASKIATPQKWPIASLAVEGLKNYSQQQALAVVGLKIGQVAGTADFDAARDRLLAAGVFETVGYRFAPAAGSSGYAASFQVVEVAPVYPVRLEGLNAPENEITAWLVKSDPFFGPKIPATTAILKRNVTGIEQYLAGKGRNEKIEAKVVADSPEQFAIVFRPASGAPKVAEVRFRGNAVVPASVLLNNFAGVAYGTVYSESAFRQMLDASVRPIYDARGRVRVAFTKLDTEKAKDVEGLVVTVAVDEGETYDLGEVRLEGESPVPEKQLLKIGGFKPGDLANFDDVAAGLERMKKRLRREGYMRAALQVERHIDDKKKTVGLSIRPELGPQFLFGTLTIEGLDIHGEAAVRKLWGIKEGKTFDGDYPDYFLQQIREQGLFDDLGPTKSASKANEESHVVDVTLTFQASKGSDEGSPTRLRRRDR